MRKVHIRPDFDRNQTGEEKRVGRVNTRRSVVLRKMSAVSFIVLMLTVVTAGVLLADYLGTDVVRVFLDPESVPVVADGYDDNDIISYILEQTPDALSGSTRGSASWMTVYIPDGVEVVGAEFITPNSDGTYIAIPAEDTAAIADGCGERGCSFPTSGTLRNGKLNEGQQDTGIFYSTDSRTQLLTTPVNVSPTGIGAVKAYNQWDADQVFAFGDGNPSPLSSSNQGEGNTPVVQIGGTWFGTGSPVAGPDTYFIKDYDPACNASTSVELDLHCTGPWQRIQYANAKIGGSGAVAPTTTNPGANTNTSAPITTGHVLSPANELPSGVNAVRYNFGFRRVGDIELARITYRIVNAAAFEASVFGANSEFCLDGTGSDTDKLDQNRGVQDNPWRYYEGKTLACLTGDANGLLLKQAQYVNGVLNSGTALKTGDVIGYAISFTNNSGATLYDIDFSDAATLNIDLVGAGTTGCPYANYHGDQGGQPTFNSNSFTTSAATWNRLDMLAPGATVTVHMCAKVKSNAQADAQVKNTGTVDHATTDGGGQVTQHSVAVGTITSRISGTVYDDGDGSGTLTAGDIGIPGVEVKLYIDVNKDGKLDAGDIFQTTATTNDAGQYQFNGLSAETYIVVESDPANYASTGDSTPSVNCAVDDQCNIIQVALTAGEHSENNDFFDEQLGYAIGDTVFRDWNGNGSQDSEDEGLPGAIVSILPPPDVDLGAGDGVAITTTTDANGSYQFTKLPDTKTYTVTVTTVPAGYTLTADPDGPALSTTYVQTLAGADVDTVDWGFKPGGSGTIGDLVWHDEDRDGTNNGGAESGIPDVTVTLYEDGNNNGVIDAEDAQVAVTQSGADGSYGFTGLDPDIDYLVKVDEDDPDLAAFFGTTGYALFSSNPHDVPGTLTNLGGAYAAADFGFGLLIVKEVSATEAKPGDTLTYTITAAYPGRGPLTNVTVTDTIPVSTTFVVDSDVPAAVVTPADNEMARLITWNLGSTDAANDSFMAGQAGGAGHNYEDDLNPTLDTTDATTAGAVDTGVSNWSGTTNWAGQHWFAEVLESGGGDSKVKFDNNLEVKAKKNAGDFAAASRVVPLNGQSAAIVQITLHENVKENRAGDAVVFQARLASGDAWTTLHGFSTANSAATFNALNIDLASLGSLTDTTEIRFLATAGGGGSGKDTSEAKIKLTSVTINGTLPGEPALTTKLSASPALVQAGDEIKVTLTLTASAAVNDVTPAGALTSAGANGAVVDTVNDCTGPILFGDDDIADASDPVIYQWSCTGSAGTPPDSEVSFFAGASGTVVGSGANAIWLSGESNSVLIAPKLTFQVVIEDPTLVTSVDNQAYLNDDNIIADPIPSNLVKTDILSVSSLPVSLSYFRATRNGDNVDFIWETATEAGNAGFNLYAEVNGNLNLINGELIPSTVIDSVEVVQYSYRASVVGELFYIEQIDISGQRARKGPFALGEEYGVSGGPFGTPNGVELVESFYLPFIAH